MWYTSIDKNVSHLNEIQIFITNDNGGKKEIIYSSTENAI